MEEAMGTHWALQDAKNRLSEVVDRAVREGPQTITRRGKTVAIVVSAEQFTKLSSPRGDLVSFLRSSPLVGEDLDLSRKDDYGRETDL
jgi:antitoxin Phd